MPALAQFIGANALPLLAGLIVAAGLFTRLLWQRALRYQASVNARPLTIVGLGVAVLALVLFLIVASLLSRISIFDALLANELRRTISRPMLQAIFAITQFGNFMTLLAVVIGVALALLLRRRWLELGAWLIATAGNGLLNRALKLSFERARPLYDHGLVIEPSYSFPSGHASGSLAVYGMLTWLLLHWLPAPARLPLLIGTTTLILLIGFSRVLLQVHYFSDVIAGFASAAAWLSLCIVVAERLRQRQVCRA
ncbi:phosphatase PAP2 family protein [uncultured Nevskia sp.]|uniref:phosphatase PAP2 family protein n=1 Tax=uncultured Nevskia sp. TaxID=228950 RepID=UPI0025F6062D|nr:phosphatase PAP2 family protein [uncultured Nevskia sp.]